MFPDQSYSIDISHRDVPLGVWIGPSSVLACPYQVGKDGTRSQVIRKYRAWLWQQLHEKGDVHVKLLKLSNQAGVMDLTLVCRCPVCPQHARVIKSCIEWMSEPGNYELFLNRLEHPPGYKPDWSVDIAKSQPSFDTSQ